MQANSTDLYVYKEKIMELNANLMGDNLYTWPQLFLSMRLNNLMVL